MVSRDISKEGPFTAHSTAHAGGGNFDVTMWLGNVWIYSTLAGARVREMIEGSGERKTYKIIKEAVNPEQAQVLKKILGGKELNVGQRGAIKSVLMAKDFSLIQGFPGSGKTQTIVKLVQILLGFGKRILITAHTHSAVDNLLSRILEKLSPADLKKTARIGDKRKFDLSVRHVAEDRFLKVCTDGEELKKLYSEMKLIAGTCMGVARHQMLIEKKADYVIVDEAGQVSEPILLGALFHGGENKQYCSFVLQALTLKFKPQVKYRTEIKNS